MTDAPHWTEPGAHRVDDGIHRIPLPLPMDGLRAVNVYTIETEEGLTLVDGGWALDASRKQLDESLASIGRTVSDITRFLVTHVHRDHYTQAVAVRREVGSHVSLGLGDRGNLDVVRGGHGSDPTVPQIRRTGADAVAAGWQEAMGGQVRTRRLWEYPDTWLDGDQKLSVGTRTIDAVSTPGHTQGHFVFADLEAGLLFAGDHVLPTITPSIGFEPAYADQPLGDFLGSLAKVRAMPDLRLLPAHGDVTRPRTRGSTRWSPTTTSGSRSAWPPCSPAGPRRTPSRATCPGPGTSGTSTSWTCSTPRSRRWRRWRTSSCWPRGARSRASTTVG